MTCSIALEDHATSLRCELNTWFITTTWWRTGSKSEAPPPVRARQRSSAAVGVLDEVSLDHADRLEVREVAVVPQLDGGGGEGGGSDGGGWEGGGGE
eukprot:scaffold70938_cov62-Phaeocystis_antarctica.AAC.1